MLIVPLILIAKNWKQFRFLQKDEWLNKPRFTYHEMLLKEKKKKESTTDTQNNLNESPAKKPVSKGYILCDSFLK